METKQSFYICEECGEASIKWLGRCPACGSFGTMRAERKRGERGRASPTEVEPLLMGQMVGEPQRLMVGIDEFDRVLGGGAVPGSLVLLGGEPGIGKSTLLLQVGHSLTGKGVRVLIVSGEESASQIASRARRTGTLNPDLFLLCETDLESVIEAARRLAPQVLIVDSIQAMRSQELDSSPGGVNQMREGVYRLQNLAKELETVVFLVGHVTKEGILAGPRMVEHMVDCVLYFEGERFDTLRILRAVKNRFGSLSELGIFEMTDSGLREVEDPSHHFLDSRDGGVPGTASTVIMEGRRPLVVQIQSLVVPSKLPNPKRISSGIDHRRLAINLAVLERKANIRLFDRDVYVGVSGGLKVTEPALDLGLCLAVASSRLDKSLPKHSIFLGEVSLTGMVRPVSRPGDRAREAARLGFRYLALSPGTRSRPKVSGIELIEVEHVGEALRKAGLA